MLTKAELRSQLQAARLALPEAERVAKSQAILAALQALVDRGQTHSIHTYKPIEALGEVDIMPFVQILQCLVAYPQKVDGQWHIDEQKFDIILVPMIGFDASLHRLGYGGGYYDKFLATQPQATKIGVCFELGKVDALPIEPHDIALDYIVTEAATYTP